MVINQMNHQESVASNLQQLTSNPLPLHPTPALWYQLSWGEIIIMPLIIVVLKSHFRIFWLNLTLNQFQVQTPLRLNQLIMIKWIISWNSSIQNMMHIFWMLTSIIFNLEWWLLVLQNSIQSQLCCLINMEEQMLQLQIACHTFLCLSQPRTL